MRRRPLRSKRRRAASSNAFATEYVGRRSPRPLSKARPSEAPFRCPFSGILPDQPPAGVPSADLFELRDLTPMLPLKSGWLP